MLTTRITLRKLRRLNAESSENAEVDRADNARQGVPLTEPRGSEATAGKRSGNREKRYRWLPRAVAETEGGMR